MLVYKPLQEAILPEANIIPRKKDAPRPNLCLEAVRMVADLIAHVGTVAIILMLLFNTYWYVTLTDSDPYTVQELRKRFKTLQTVESYQIKDVGEIIEYLVDSRKDGLFLESVVGSAPNHVGPWMVDRLGWRGVVVEPNHEKFNKLRFKHANRSRIDVMKGAFGSLTFPSLSYYFTNMDGIVWEIPIFTLLMGLETMNCDLLSFGGYGNEVDVSNCCCCFYVCIISNQLNFCVDLEELATKSHEHRYYCCSLNKGPTPRHSTIWPIGGRCSFKTFICFKKENRRNSFIPEIL